MDEPQTAGEAARSQLAAESIALAFTIAGAVLILWVQRSASDPDAFRRGKMRGAKIGERLCATAAAGLWKLAERYRLAYESERP